MKKTLLVTIPLILIVGLIYFLQSEKSTSSLNTSASDSFDTETSTVVVPKAQQTAIVPSRTTIKPQTAAKKVQQQEIDTDRFRELNGREFMVELYRKTPRNQMVATLLALIDDGIIDVNSSIATNKSHPNYTPLFAALVNADISFEQYQEFIERGAVIVPPRNSWMLFISSQESTDIALDLINKLAVTDNELVSIRNQSLSRSPQLYSALIKSIPLSQQEIEQQISSIEEQVTESKNGSTAMAQGLDILMSSDGISAKQQQRISELMPLVKEQAAKRDELMAQIDQVEASEGKAMQIINKYAKERGIAANDYQQLTELCEELESQGKIEYQCMLFKREQRLQDKR
ncbi:MAG: hypothetical protein ACPG8A_11340 [Psychrobium sp.]